jgi:hypothetical protein
MENAPEATTDERAIDLYLRGCPSAISVISTYFSSFSASPRQRFNNLLLRASIAA